MFLQSLSSHDNSPSFHGESGNGMEFANKGLTVQTCCASFPIYYYDRSPGLKGPHYSRPNLLKLKPPVLPLSGWIQCTNEVLMLLKKQEILLVSALKRFSYSSSISRHCV